MRDEKQTTIHPDSGPAGDGPPAPPLPGVPPHERILAAATVACVVLGLGAAAGVQAAELHQSNQPVAAAMAQTTTPTTPAPQTTPSQAAPVPATTPSSGAAQPSPATDDASEVPGGPPSVTGPVDGVDWTTLSYPLDCGGIGYRVQFVTQPVDLQHDGGREAAVAVTCAGNGGSPPSAVYVYRLANSGQGLASSIPVATLLTPDQYGYIVTTLSADADGVTFATAGYSSDLVPRYSPDLHEQQHWAWIGQAFTRVS